MDATLTFDARALLGEGPVWDPDSSKLYWTDILRGELHVFNPETNEDVIHRFNSFVTAISRYQKDKLVLVMKDGFYLYDLMYKQLTLLKKPEKMDHSLRFNDGKCDPAGRLWAGTMSMEGKKEKGAFYRLEKDLQITTIIEPVSISNGLDWDREKHVFYYIDTPTMEIKQFQYDPETGNLSNQEVVYRFEEDAGYPDGMTIDQEGNLWVALFGGGKAVKIDPGKKEWIDTIHLPVRHVTCCAFGGTNMKTLFITTASIPLSEKERADNPHAGSLFSVELQVGGFTPESFKCNAQI
ncbi:SMP-30/gluconolactonase/LRE family protein [Bacillus gobiensis]|uniref:SMP-30/gluconolactonase/LRE family protein n=1 Tax=Bacillus gobiensis TaxID=1441095 RepID=UPI003D1EE447